MKKLLFCLAAVALFFTACNNDDYPNGDHYFFLGNYSLSFPAKYELDADDMPILGTLSREIKVTHDYNGSWTATSDASWCRVEALPEFGFLYVTVDPYDNEDVNRTAKITVTIDGATELIPLYTFGEIAITQLRYIPDITADLVGTYDAIGWVVSGSTAYDIARTVTITAVEGKKEVIYVTDVSGINLFMDPGEELDDNVEMAVKSSLMEVIMPTFSLGGPFFTDTHDAFVSPMVESTYCGNMGKELTFEVEVGSDGMHTLTANSGGAPQDWQGVTYNRSTVLLATDASGACLGGGLWGFGAIWKQVSKDPSPIVPQSIRRPIQISKYMLSEPLPLNE